MPFRDVLAVTKRLLTGAIVRRGAIFSALVLVERLLLPAAAWSLFRHSVAEQMLFLFAAGAAFTGRTFVQHAFRAKTEVELLERVASRLLGGDVLRANALPDEDARAELGQAMYHAAQNIAVVLPLLLADGLAAPTLILVVVAKEPTRLLGIAIGMTVAAGAMLLVGRRSIERVLTEAWTAQREAFVGFMDALEGRLEVVASGRRDAFLAQMHVRAAAWGKAGARIAVGALVSGKLPFLIIAGIVAIAIALAGTSGRSALGVTAADIALLASMTPAFSGVAQDLFALARTERWMSVVARALSEAPLSVGGGQQPPQSPEPIAFEGVSFWYDGVGEPALRRLTFTWNRERVLALTGANGSGKSTCLRLLLAMATPQSGTIKIAGVPLESLDADAWRKGVAFLPQRPYLPPGSDVRGAIHFLAPGATDDRIREAVDRVGLSTALARFGGDPLAARIGALSVGERQRIGVARLLCRNAALVLLDEPDANLDRVGIALMARLVRELAKHTKVALVAHSVDLLEVADRVLTLDGGQLMGDEKPKHGGPLVASVR